MNVLDQVEQLKSQAINLLLAERQRIDAELAILQPDKKTAPLKKRGRPAKSEQPINEQPLTQQDAPVL